jgi:NitT/TauT family transport system substrate-binding protein
LPLSILISPPLRLRSMSRVAAALVNLMETDDAERYLGGRYEFIGVSVRTAEIATRREQMRALARALDKGLSRLQKIKPEEITGALPKQLLAGVECRD